MGRKFLQLPLTESDRSHYHYWLRMEEESSVDHSTEKAEDFFLAYNDTL